MTETTATWTAADFRAWRGRQGWTQAQAAEELRLHLQTVKHIESGRNPITPIVRRLAEMLEASPVETASMLSADLKPPPAAPEEDLRFARAVRAYAHAAVSLADAHCAGGDVPGEVLAAVDAAADVLDVAFSAGATEDSTRKALWLRRLAESSVALCVLLSRRPMPAAGAAARGLIFQPRADGLVAETLDETAYCLTTGHTGSAGQFVAQQLQPGTVNEQGVTCVEIVPPGETKPILFPVPGLRPDGLLDPAVFLPFLLSSCEDDEKPKREKKMSLLGKISRKKR